jgi:predicted alpha/beta hydrolase
MAARQPDRVHGLLPIASGSVALWRAIHAPASARHPDLLGLVSGISGAMVGHFPGQRIGFGGREARGVMKDWVHVAHTGRYEPVGIGFQLRSARWRTLAMPVLALNFQGDSWAPEAAASYLLGKLPQCQREPVDSGAMPIPDGAAPGPFFLDQTPAAGWRLESLPGCRAH